MILTTIEAREKVCPFFQQGNLSNLGHNLPAPNDMCLCLSNDCMAWRWLEPDKKGYCGLASYPLLPSAIFTDKIKIDTGAYQP